MKIIAIGRNYADHNKEIQHSLFISEPVVYIKPDSALLKNGKPFFIPDFSSDVRYETALVIKIGRLGKNIAEQFAPRYCHEITVGIDFTACDLLTELRNNALPWEIAKGFDASAVVGEFLPISRAGNLRQLDFHLDIDGRTVQHGNTADMIFPVNRIIACASRYFTLKTGDLIYTGTPPGTGTVHIGNHLQGYLGERKLLDFHVR
jgi:2-keto-4-pentenoate hydratase/2-oxohepta-3-ene-1,7-dioic acid hydratase in catechol pathway